MAVRWQFWKTERRDTDVAQDLLTRYAAFLATSGTTAASPTATAAVTACVGALSRPFATASVVSPVDALTGTLIEDIARRALLHGEAVFAVEVDGVGLSLVPAAAWEVAGTASRWIYELEIASPSGRHQTIRRPAEGVVHVRLAPPPSAPWKGIAPWQQARLSSETLAYIERSLRWDAEVPTGQLLPVPDGATDDQTNSVSNAIQNGKGALTLVDTVHNAWGQGPNAKPQADYESKRFGATVPENNVTLRDAATLSIYAAYGVPSSYLNGDGNAQVVARRAMFLDVIEPLARRIESELSRKLEEPVVIGLQASEYADWQRISRAASTLVDLGYSMDQVATMLGINERTRGTS